LRIFEARLLAGCQFCTVSSELAAEFDYFVLQSRITCSWNIYLTSTATRRKQLYLNASLIMTTRQWRGLKATRQEFYSEFF